MGRKKPDWFATCGTVSRPNGADASVQFMATAARCACCTDGHVGNAEGPGGFNAGIAGRYAWQAVRADKEEVGRIKAVESGIRKQTILYFSIFAVLFLYHEIASIRSIAFFAFLAVSEGTTTTGASFSNAVSIFANVCIFICGHTAVLEMG